MSETTLQEAREYVKSQEPPITDLISPSDLIHQDIDNWEDADIDRLREEIGASMGDAWTYGINHPYGDLIEEVAVNRFVDDMTRLPMDHLNPEKFQGIEDMVIEGYWPFETSREEIRELVYEWNSNIEFFHEYEDDVRMEIESAILEARLEGLK